MRMLLRAIYVCAIAAAIHLTVAAQPTAPTSRVRGLKARLSSVEETLNAIQSSKQIDDPYTGKRVAADLDAAATEARRAFDAALAEAKGIAERGGDVKEFEFLRQIDLEMKGERGRAEKIVEQMSAVDAAIRTGDVKLSKRALESLTPAERREFRKTLTPKADQEYRRDHPSLFVGEVRHFTDQEWLALKQCDACDAHKAAMADSKPRPGLLVQLYDAITEGLTPSANAALGGACYAICAASTGSVCVQCVVAAGIVVVRAYNGFVGCWNACCGCRWYRPWCCACKAACVVGFLGLLA